jgi:hypothetical protein
VDAKGDVWVAHSNQAGASATTVGHLKNNGTWIGNVNLQAGYIGKGPTGVSVDANGKIWSSNMASGTLSRINPNAGPTGDDGVTPVGAVDMEVVLPGYPYNYGKLQRCLFSISLVLAYSLRILFLQIRRRHGMYYFSMTPPHLHQSLSS